MSYTVAGDIDIALLAFWAFVAFFIALVVYLQRESYREGYPLEDAVTGRYEVGLDIVPLPKKKIFRLPFDRGTVTVPNPHAREPVEIAARRMDRSPGSPYVPTGNPLVDGIGPAAYANRAKLPDIDMEGHPRIVPIGNSGMWVSRHDTDPRGLPMIGSDGVRAGTITDLWIDKADRLIRYLAVDTGTRSVLVPFAMCVVRRAGVVTDSINAAQFADAPVTPAEGIITFYEEERVLGYFGGGYLYSSPSRQEPLL
jgi:photosynthetic reaction center H subunit